MGNQLHDIYFLQLRKNLNSFLFQILAKHFLNCCAGKILSFSFLPLPPTFQSALLVTRREFYLRNLIKDFKAQSKLLFLLSQISQAQINAHTC